MCESFFFFSRVFLSVSCFAFFFGRGLVFFVCVVGALLLFVFSFFLAVGFAGGVLLLGSFALFVEGITGLCSGESQQQQQSACSMATKKEYFA